MEWNLWQSSKPRSGSRKSRVPILTHLRSWVGSSKSINATQMTMTALSRLTHFWWNYLNWPPKLTLSLRLVTNLLLIKPKWRRLMSWSSTSGRWILTPSKKSLNTLQSCILSEDTSQQKNTTKMFRTNW